MKKLIIIIILSVLSFDASDWKEIQCVEIPHGTPVYYCINSDTGKIKYSIYFNGVGVNVSETNAKAFVSGQRRLELVKWYNEKIDAYKYTIRQLKLKDVDLNQLIKDYDKDEKHNH